LPNLEVRSGTLGHSRDAGTGAKAITDATCKIFSRFCSRFYGAREIGSIKQTMFVKKRLRTHLRKSVKVITVDSAADEVLSCEMMRSSALSALKTRATPNLQFVVRDKTHGSRRLISRGWGTDAFLKEIVQLFCRSRASMARIIQNSRPIQCKFRHYIATSIRVVGTVAANMRAAAHRYESMQKPFGRSVLFIHAVIRTALWCTQTRTDESSRSAADWLLWINNERCVQAAMMADASDQTLMLTRLLDSENVDPAILVGEVRTYLATIDLLFGDQERCLTVFGYTKVMLDTLSRPMVWSVKGTGCSIGSERGVPRSIILKCLDRMRCWIKLMRATLAVEFPDFEIAHAFDLDF